MNTHTDPGARLSRREGKCKSRSVATRNPTWRTAAAGLVQTHGETSELPYTCAEVVSTDTPELSTEHTQSVCSRRMSTQSLFLILSWLAGAGAPEEALTQAAAGHVAGQARPTGARRQSSTDGQPGPTSKGALAMRVVNRSQEHHSPWIKWSP